MNVEDLNKCLKILDGMTKEKWDELSETLIAEQKLDAENRAKFGESYANKALKVPAPPITAEERKELELQGFFAGKIIGPSAT